jgi:hypothetical protein
VRKRPEIPEDVFFDDAEPAQEPEPEEQPKRTETRQPRSYTRREQPTAEVEPEPEPAVPKFPVTLYLTEPVLYRLEEARFRLLTEHGVKTSKSAIANYALASALQDLNATADALRED